MLVPPLIQATFVYNVQTNYMYLSKGGGKF